MKDKWCGIAEDRIYVEYQFPSWVTEAEIRLVSRRNNPISAMTDISSYNPLSEEERVKIQRNNKELLFPVMDCEIVSGCYMELQMESAIGEYCVNPAYYKSVEPLTEQIVIPQNRLRHWENIVYLSDRRAVCRKTSIVIRRPVACGRLDIHIGLLSPMWAGTILLYGCSGKRKECFEEDAISYHWYDDTESLSERKEDEAYTDTWKGICTCEEVEPEREKVLHFLKDTLQFLFRARNTDKDSLAAGGMYLLYDLDSRCYRADHWNWTWGPAIKLLLDSLEIPELQDSLPAEERIQYAKSMGESILRFQMRSPWDECFGLFMVRWQEMGEAPLGMCGYYSAADSGFCAKWGLIPLYKYTKDPVYREAVETLYEGVLRWYERFGVIPSDYLTDMHDYAEWTLDETMFITGLFAEMKNCLGHEEAALAGSTIFDEICGKLWLGDGRWARVYNRKDDSNSGFCHDTKGHGWAMDGLLCACEMNRTQLKYLEMACKTAEIIIHAQQPEGFWYNYFDLSDTADNGGIGEKSTALWSWLLYRLYGLVQDSRYLTAARKALTWCMNHQYHGPDPEAYGSIIAVSAQSGIIYRPYFRISCTYTNSFMGLAAMEELRLKHIQETGEEQPAV